MQSEGLGRREVLIGMVGAVAVAACAGEGDDTSADDTASVQGTWATGGTANLAESYAVTFDDSCAQTCEMTLGPCYGQTEDRKDISEGQEGLPMRVAFKVVDTDCQPVEGAVVDIWHCSVDGVYSGSDVAAMCAGGDAAALAAHWFRGQQTTDAEGRVDFDSCFPGWYPGRAVHIHFQVLVGGQAWVVSQLGFRETLNTDVFANHPDYTPSGQPDTPNASDGILRLGDAYLFDWRQAEDGALVVWKTLTLRTSLSEPRC